MNKNAKIVVSVVVVMMMAAVIVVGLIASNAYQKLSDTQDKLQSTERRLKSAKSNINELKTEIETLKVDQRSMFDVLVNGDVKYDAFELLDGSHVCFTKQTNGGYSFISVSNK